MSSWWDAVTSYLTVHAEEKQEEDDDKEGITSFSASN